MMMSLMNKIIQNLKQLEIQNFRRFQKTVTLQNHQKTKKSLILEVLEQAPSQNYNQNVAVVVRQRWQQLSKCTFIQKSVIVEIGSPKAKSSKMNHLNVQYASQDSKTRQISSVINGPCTPMSCSRANAVPLSLPMPTTYACMKSVFINVRIQTPESMRCVSRYINAAFVENNLTPWIWLNIT